ncbi:hypothetical protein ASD74_06415 [Rhizobium sp. Root564]|nr:hypothetical protein ASD74_06415 [Rhizobium sp. Root564]
MTKKAAILQADLKRMAAIAKSEGVVVSVEVDGRRFSVSPYVPPEPVEEYPFQHIKSFEEWKNRHSKKKPVKELRL